jgi:hypothetical protein
MSLLPGSAIPLSGYNINNSLRFRSSATAYLSRTPASTGNRKTWTWSAWVKRGDLSTAGILFNAGDGTVNNRINILFPTANTGTLLIQNSIAATNTILRTTTAVFRDPSAWYHIVLAVDTTQATAANRIKLYVNGNEITSFSASADLALNYDTYVNSTNNHRIGFATTSPFDGYMTEVNFVDGQALTPSSFGSTNPVTGVWQPKQYTGTYGTNGFYLNFSNIALTSGSNAGLGRDFSGNGNFWNTVNISVTAGVTYDSMVDVPTLTSATVANYAVLNPLDNGGNALSGANLNISSPSSTAPMTRGTIGVSSGKWYWEVTYTTAGTSSIGIASQAGSNTGTVGQNTYSWGYLNDARKYFNSSATAYGASYTTNDVIGVALDMDAGTLTFYKNGVSQGTAFSSITGTIFPAISDYSTAAAAWSCNFGQRPFAYTPPTGFARLNTYNLPDSTIKKGNTVMDATLYTGNASTQTITNAAGFKPDFVWTKSRANAYQPNLYNSISGVNKFLQSNNTNAETTLVGSLTSFNSNGYTLGNQDNSNFTNGSTAVGWQWQAGQGSTSTNTAGSVTSTVSVNTTAGFSVATFTSPLATAFTIGHGLGVAPKFIIMKSLSTAGTWFVYHASLGATMYLVLQTTAAQASAAQPWNNTAPTFSLISMANLAAANRVAYSWAEIAGFSKFGSYTGNGSADGPFVYTEFRPKFIMMKNASAIGNWLIKDTSRNPFNITTANLYPNLTNAEDVVATAYIDILSNGFKLRGTYADINGSTNQIVYAAFAENPFKNALAR